MWYGVAEDYKLLGRSQTNNHQDKLLLWQLRTSNRRLQLRYIQFLNLWWLCTFQDICNILHGQTNMPQLMQLKYTHQMLPSRFPLYVMQHINTQSSQSSWPPIVVQPSWILHQYQLVSSSVIASVVISHNINSYIMKKDLISQRLRRYDDDPSSCTVWKRAFKNIVSEAIKWFERKRLVVTMGRTWIYSLIKSTSMRRANQNDAKCMGDIGWMLWIPLDTSELRIHFQLQKFPVITLPKAKPFILPCSSIGRKICYARERKQLH